VAILSKHLKEAQDRLRKAFNSKIDEIQGLMAEEYAQEQRVDEAEEDCIKSDTTTRPY